MVENSKLGLQYFSDNLHYHQSEAEYWLNEFKDLGVNWLVLDNSDLIAIPESFLTALLELNITPILRFNFPYPLQKPPHEFQLLLSFYQKIGIRYTVFFDQPNSQKFWSEKEWFHGDIVERFIDLFLPYAKIAIANGMQPVFPPLVVAEEYWDTAFLRLSLESLLRRQEDEVIAKLVLSAYAHTGDLSRPLNWGAGGPHRFPASRPFFRPENSQDQKGIHNDDWYQAIAQAVIGQPLPLILFEASPSITLSQLADLNIFDKRRLTIVQNLLPFQSQTPAFSNDEEILPLSTHTICFIFSQLVEQLFSQTNYLAWYDLYRHPKPFTNQVKSWVRSANFSSHLHGTAKDNRHVLLLPPLPKAQLNQELAQIQPYLLQKQPKIVFSIAEALQAERVTLLSHLDFFSAEELNRLENQHCEIELISQSGTKIVTV